MDRARQHAVVIPERMHLFGTPTKRTPNLQKQPYSPYDHINSKPALYQTQSPSNGNGAQALLPSSYCSKEALPFLKVDLQLSSESFPEPCSQKPAYKNPLPRNILNLRSQPQFCGSWVVVSAVIYSHPAVNANYHKPTLRFFLNPELHGSFGLPRSYQPIHPEPIWASVLVGSPLPQIQTLCKIPETRRGSSIRAPE